MTDNILGTKKVSFLFVKYALPAVISMVIAGSQSIIDGMFLGNFVGPNALASINIIQPFMSVIIGTSMVMSIGSLSIIGRKLGEGKKKEAQNTFRTALISLLAASILIALIGMIFSSGIADILGSNAALKGNVTSYIGTISIFSPFIILMFLFGFGNRVMGYPELYLKSTIISLICNVTLDYIFIKHLALGVRGAAFATGLSYTVAFCVCILPMLRRENTLSIFTGKFQWDIIPPAVANGASEAVVSVASAITAYLFNRTFMSIAGESGIAAFSTINYISQFGILIMFGISDGISAILSYNYGFKKIKRVFETLRISWITNIVIGAVLFLVLFIFGENLVSMFVSDPDVISLASNGSKLYSVSFLLCGFSIINSGYFTALGNAKESIIIASSRGLFFIIIGIMILPQIFGVNGVWLTLPFAELCTFIIGTYLVTRKNKKLKLLLY